LQAILLFLQNSRKNPGRKRAKIRLMPSPEFSEERASQNFRWDKFLVRASLLLIGLGAAHIVYDLVDPPRTITLTAKPTPSPGPMPSPTMRGILEPTPRGRPIN
jgi:hypothetical protein